jgi:hypothetical protein
MGMSGRTPSGSSNSDTDLVVDPGFELYSGLEERRPQPVPLEVHLYEETSAIRKYIDQENRLYKKVFALTNTQPTAQREVIIGVPAAEYESLQDFCYLNNEIRLDHTLVFQVDEFWAIRSNSALHDLSSYMRESTSAQGQPCPGVDPFALFQPTLASRPSGVESKERFQYFPVHFPPEWPSSSHRIDRIPFCWDFGFLLCRKRAWELACSNPIIDKCWRSLRKVDDAAAGRKGGISPVTWFDFLFACREVARAESARTSKPIAAFDLSILAPESFSCLVLEMWASEIFSKGILQANFCERNWGKESHMGLLDWLDEGADLWNIYERWKKGERSARFRGHWLDLYKVWLLLGATLDLQQIANPTSAFEFRSREADQLAVASRHWYKTASGLADTFSTSDPLVATQLPGMFSVRGDWFLSVSKNSRSLRLAYRAIDLLSSRRANISRMQIGLGLPARDILPVDAYDRSRTRLFKPGLAGERRSVAYEDLRYIGAGKYTGLRWLWRSSLRDYDRHARVFQKWLYRMMILLGQLKLSTGREWIDNFEVVRRLSDAQDDPAQRQKFFSSQQRKSMDAFVKRVAFLVTELKQASPPL